MPLNVTERELLFEGYCTPQMQNIFCLVFFECCLLLRELLDGLAVDPNTQVDKYCPCSAIVRVCEDGLLEFVRVLVEKGANVSDELISTWYTFKCCMCMHTCTV